jgi:hypothetical protein
MRKSVSLLIVPAVLVAAACGRDNSKPVDDALRNDLALASAMYQPQQIVSPMEQGYGYPPGAYGQPVRQYNTGGYYYPTPATARPAPAPRARSAGTYSTGTTRPATRTTTVKHTKRDAAIGAVAGAAIGAVTSRDKLKGAVIGAAAGGLLGAVIGNNVDKSKIPIPC